MSPNTHSHDRHWSYEDVRNLRQLVNEGVPDSVISLKMKRSIADIHAKLSELGLVARTG